MVMVRIRKEKRCRGAATIEYALTLPLFLIIAFGSLQYGWGFLVAQRVTNAARYGARVAVRADASTQDVVDAMYGLLSLKERELITKEEFSGRISYEVNGVSRPDISSANKVGDAITVIVTVSWGDIPLLAPFLRIPRKADGTPKNIVGRITMAKEGF